MKGSNDDVRLRTARALRHLRREVKRRDRELGILAHRLAEYQINGAPKGQLQFSSEGRAAPYRTLRTELLYRWIAEFAVQLKKRGEPRKNIIADAVKAFEVSDRTIEEALKQNEFLFQ